MIFCAFGGLGNLKNAFFQAISRGIKWETTFDSEVFCERLAEYLGLCGFFSR